MSADAAMDRLCNRFNIICTAAKDYGVSLASRPAGHAHTQHLWSDLCEAQRNFETALRSISIAPASTGDYLTSDMAKELLAAHRLSFEVRHCTYPSQGPIARALKAIISAQAAAGEGKL